MKHALVIALIGLLLPCAGAQSQARTANELTVDAQSRLDDFPRKDTGDASVFRGTIVFMNYCSNCHGVNADGKGRAARLYEPKPANLRASMMNDLYKEKIIHRGGKVMGRSGCR